MSELENVDKKIDELAQQLNVSSESISPKVKDDAVKQKTDFLFDSAIDALMMDREKVKTFVYSLLDEYYKIKDENDNFSDQLADTVLSEEQKKFVYSKLKANNKRLEMILDTLPALISILTDIPKKTIDVYIKKLDLDRATETITVQGLISREKLYD